MLTFDNADNIKKTAKILMCCFILGIIICICSNDLVFYDTAVISNMSSFYSLISTGSQTLILDYHNQPNYTDTLTPYHTCSKVWTSPFYYCKIVIFGGHFIWCYCQSRWNCQNKINYQCSEDDLIVMSRQLPLYLGKAGFCMNYRENVTNNFM